MFLRASAPLLAGTALLVIGAMPAAAIEPDEAAEALGAALTEGSDVAASYESAEFEGDDIVISEFKITRTASEQTATFERIVIEAPTEDDEDVFESPKITFSSGTLGGEAKGSVASVVVTDARVLDPAKGKKNGFGGSILFLTAEATDVHMGRTGQPGEVAIERIVVESGDIVDDVAVASRGSVENVALSPEFIAARGIDPKSIGYDALVFDLAWDSSRDTEAKTMTINSFTVTFHDGGELSVDGVVGNLPDPRVLNDAEATSKASAAEVHRLTIRYDDNSFAGRLLDFLAQKQGITRAEYAQQMSAALPFILMPLNNPGFQSQVASAVTNFLQNPHSMTIEIAPDSPVSGTEIMALVQSAPGTIPDRLKATVTANAPE